MPEMLQILVEMQSSFFKLKNEENFYAASTFSKGAISTISSAYVIFLI